MKTMSFPWLLGCTLACCACAANSPAWGPESFAVGVLSASAQQPIQLADWTPAEDLFAVGSLADGSGELTIDDGEVWVTRPDDGSEPLMNLSIAAKLHRPIRFSHSGNLRTERNFESEATCTQLVHARVKDWIELEISHEIAAAELAQKLAGLARSTGLDTRRPIPLRIVGEFRDIEWHVGREPTIHNASAQGALVGFLAPHGPEIFAQPGERLHLHLLQPSQPGPNGAVSGHVERTALRAGARISFPGGAD